MTIKNLIKKYSTFLKYILSAGISFLIDLSLFTVFNLIFRRLLGNYSIICATILARIISSLINYRINRNTVFKKDEGSSKMDKQSFIKYITLVIVQMFTSSLLVYALYNALKINEILIKVPVECALFIVNYFVQKLFIFNKKRS